MAILTPNKYLLRNLLRSKVKGYHSMYKVPKRYSYEECEVCYRYPPCVDKM